MFNRKGKVMRSDRLSDVVGVTCGAGSHQLVVLHMRDKKDLVFSLHSPQNEDRVGELIAVLATIRGWDLRYFLKWPFIYWFPLIYNCSIFNYVQSPLKYFLFRVENLKVKVSEEIHCFMGGNSKTIVFQQDPNTTLPHFSKSKSGYVFSYPS